MSKETKKGQREYSRSQWINDVNMKNKGQQHGMRFTIPPRENIFLDFCQGMMYY